MKTLMKLGLTALIVAGAVGLTVRGVPADTGSGLDQRTRDALVAALDDEREAQATYQAVLDRFGQVMPFRNIIRAEQRHEAMLLPLFEKYGVPVPENAWKGKKLTAPETLEAAYQQGIAFEKENAALYTGFLTFVKEPDIRSVFEHNRGASEDNHLRAFERFATGGAKGTGRRAGWGNGRGYQGGPAQAGSPRCCRAGGV
jgi:hypothetical protein